MEPAVEDELSLRDLVNILRRKRGLIVGITLLFVLLAAVYVFFIAKEVYASTAGVA